MRTASLSGATAYSCLGAYYRDDRTRGPSRKVDYGVAWLPGPAAPGTRPPPWRVTFLYSTREVIATPLSGDGPVLLLGRVPLLWFPASDTQAADLLLGGWDDPELTGWQLSWVRNRLARAGGWHLV